MREILFCLRTRLQPGIRGVPVLPDLEEILEIFMHGNPSELFCGEDPGLSETGEEIMDSVDETGSVNFFVNGILMSTQEILDSSNLFIPRGDIVSVSMARSIISDKIAPEARDESIGNWFMHYKPGRKIKEIDFVNVFYDRPDDKFSDIIPEWFDGNDKVFLKTVKKGSSFILEANDTPFECFGYSIESMSRRCLLQEFVEIDKDDHGRKEWRFFAVDGNLASASRCLDSPADMDPRAMALADKLTGIFPFACIDIFSHFRKSNGFNPGMQSCSNTTFDGKRVPEPSKICATA